MVKFSVIIPVFNGEKHVKRAIESVLQQDFSSFELLLVNDGSTDGSLSIMEAYAKKDKRIKFYTKKNTGVADTRNYAISKCKGEYFVFLDDDDTINSSLLKELNQEIERTPSVDLVKFQIQKKMHSQTFLKETPLFHGLDGEQAFAALITNDLFVTPVSYAYRRDYFLKNKFSYAYGRLHEDFGLTPLLVIRAKKVSTISYVGYNYLVRDNSLMTTNTKEDLQKKNEDMLFLYEYLLSSISRVKSISLESKCLFQSYISNALIIRCNLLTGTLLKDYVNTLKHKKVYKYLLSDTLPRKIKKMLFHFCPMLYVKIICK